MKEANSPVKLKNSGMEGNWEVSEEIQVTSTYLKKCSAYLVIGKRKLDFFRISSYSTLND